MLVILCSGRWDSLPPTFHSKASPTTATMARLRFWYPTSITELLSLVCDDHTLDADTVVVADAHILVERSLEQEELGGEVSPEKAFVRSFARLSAVLQTYMSLCAGRREDRVRVLGREDRVMGEEEMALEKEDKLVGREVKVLRTKRELVVFSTFSEGARKGLENRFGLWYPEVWTETHQVQPTAHCTSRSTELGVGCYSVTAKVLESEMGLVCENWRKETRPSFGVV